MMGYIHYNLIFMSFIKINRYFKSFSMMYYTKQQHNPQVKSLKGHTREFLFLVSIRVVIFMVMKSTVEDCVVLTLKLTRYTDTQGDSIV